MGISLSDRREERDKIFFIPIIRGGVTGGKASVFVSVHLPSNDTFHISITRIKINASLSVANIRSPDSKVYKKSIFVYPV